MKTALAIRHVPFEDLGSLEPALAAKGFGVGYVDCQLDDIAALDPTAPELLVVLGGPIGAYQDDIYPVLRDELKMLEARLRSNRPTLGICLGSQLLARVLGPRVYPNRQKEIGWSPLTLSAAGRESPLRHLSQDGIAVLHWHGDIFDLPKDATLLASTAISRNQAFSYGHSLALQFHLEATAAKLERWFIGHACEIASTPGVSVPALRLDSARYAGGLELAARACLDEWLKSLR